MCKTGGQTPLTQNMAKLMAFMYTEISVRTSYKRRSQLTRALRRRSAVARLLRLWVRIPRGHGCLSVVGVVYCQVEVTATG